ncbi:hypothetical protein D1007_08020 [Hordeum vulgare]|nr:hypothetical protein D1007_08020 [Hordeum vulgare]
MTRLAVGELVVGTMTDLPAASAEDRGKLGEKDTDKANIVRANNAARKKEKMCCYRCGEPSHFVMDCTMVLCDICLKVGHTTSTFPLFLAPKPVMTIYGVSHSRLMFLETPHTVSVYITPRQESLRTGLVMVTHGTLIEDQVSQQLRRLVSESFHFLPIRVEDEVYHVEFPRREDLDRLLKFGFSKVTRRQTEKYDVEVEVEEVSQEENNLVKNDVDMTDDGDGSGNQGADGNLGEHGAKSRDMGQASQPSKPKYVPTHKGTASSATPKSSLLFGSFEAASAWWRLRMWMGRWTTSLFLSR